MTATILGARAGAAASTTASAAAYTWGLFHAPVRNTPYILQGLGRGALKHALPIKRCMSSGVLLTTSTHWLRRSPLPIIDARVLGVMHFNVLVLQP